MSPGRTAPEGGLSRRALLAGSMSCASLLCTRCGPAPPPPPEASTPADTGVPCPDITPGSPEEGWLEISLSEHPELTEPGGWAAISLGEALLHIAVVHHTPGCWAAVWRICSHGACEVAWSAGDQALRCPCHGSLFDLDGEVRTGPASVALPTFEIAERDGSLWIHRPL